ncbi:hypothetical protein K501DRAFT_280514 [Backusella circina FSU 941]|nr:hypothetical protein K501DRAFT_280514 [Backusella circina FSU 941]
MWYFTTDTTNRDLLNPKERIREKKWTDANEKHVVKNPGLSEEASEIADVIIKIVMNALAMVFADPVPETTYPTFEVWEPAVPKCSLYHTELLTADVHIKSHNNQQGFVDLSLKLALDICLRLAFIGFNDIFTLSSERAYETKVPSSRHI